MPVAASTQAVASHIEPARIEPALIEPALIALDHASVRREGIMALDDVSLRIDLGQHTAILGANGCGKSTFVKLINRELYPLGRDREDAPSAIKLFGQSRWHVDELRQRLGLVSADLYTDLAMLNGLDVEDVVVSGFWSSYGIPDHRRVSPSMLQRAHAALERMKVFPLRHRRLVTLSAGQARRVLIARALVHEPQALLLDEPTTGLDIAARTQFMHLLAELADTGTTLVLVTHHLEEVLPQTRQVILLKHGRVFGHGTPAQMLTCEKFSALYEMPLRVVESGDGFRSLIPDGLPR